MKCFNCANPVSEPFDTVCSLPCLKAVLNGEVAEYNAGSNRAGEVRLGRQNPNLYRENGFDHFEEDGAKRMIDNYKKALAVADEAGANARAKRDAQELARRAKS
jgi:hypothetical protein